MAESSVPDALIGVTRAQIEAETHKALVESQKFAAEAREAEAKATKAELDLDREVHKRIKELAADEHHLFYAFSSGVEAASVNKCMEQLTTWMRTRPGEPMEIQFNSPGGSIVYGMALWDFIQTVKSKGHEVTTSTIGYAASMAGILLQAGDKRVMGRESWVLIHEASFGAQGKMGDIEDTVDWVRRISDRILDIFAERSNLTKAQIKRRWTRTDWWLSSDECLKHGLVDEIR